MTDPGQTITDATQPRKSTGSRTEVAIAAIVDGKAQQALHAAEKPLHSLAMGLGHALLGAAFWAVGGLCVYEKAPWWAAPVCGLVGIIAAAPTSAIGAIRVALATAGDVKDRLLPKKDA